MGRFLNLQSPHFPRKSSCSFLALCWSLGLIAGIVLYAAPNDTIQPLIFGAANCSGSFISLLMAVLLPFLLSIFVVLIEARWLLYPLAFTKAFLVSFLGLGIMQTFGSAGWLIRWLLLFSECCTLPLLILYWLRQLSKKNSFAIFPAASAVITAVLIGSVDYCIVSPFLANVLS